MLYKKFGSVPANTTYDNPYWQKLDVCKGEIVQWVIFFDPEAADLLHVRIEYHNNQIMPFSGSEWIVGFFEARPITESLKLTEEPYTLDIFAYNDDDTNSHEYFVHPIIKPEKPEVVATSTFDFKSIWDKLFGGG